MLSANIALDEPLLKEVSHCSASSCGRFVGTLLITVCFTLLLCQVPWEQVAQAREADITMDSLPLLPRRPIAGAQHGRGRARDPSKGAQHRRSSVYSWWRAAGAQANALDAARLVARLVPCEASAQTVDPATLNADFALLFDCDGVIVETEELHRLAYNKAFETFGLRMPDGAPVVWDVPYYDKLQNTVGGGKPKMKYHFNNETKAWPECTTPVRSVPQTDEEKQQLVDDLQDCKTVCYREIVSSVATARPGVLELMDKAIADPKLKVGICSAATRGGFEKIIDAVVGQERASKLDVIIAGDDVQNKKPDPEIYNKAREIIGVPKENCIVIEDSTVGLRAAKGAGMRCIITYTENTASADFYGLGADAKLLDLGRVTFDDLFGPLRAGEKELLKDFRDPGCQCSI